jgi:hypothetical protein
MLKSLAALIAATTFALPSLARVESGTTQLLQTLTEYGVTVLYNPSTCTGRFQGQYNTRKVMTLCYSGAPSASDHDTVRHEAFHFLQPCAALRRGAEGIQPLAANSTKRLQWVNKVLKPQSIEAIKRTYPAHHHQVEIEAFAAAYHYSSYDLIGLIKTWCIK